MEMTMAQVQVPPGGDGFNRQRAAEALELLKKAVAGKVTPGDELRMDILAVDLIEAAERGLDAQSYDDEQPVLAVIVKSSDGLARWVEPLVRTWQEAALLARGLPRANVAVAIHMTGGLGWVLVDDVWNKLGERPLEACGVWWNTANAIEQAMHRVRGGREVIDELIDEPADAARGAE